MINDNVTIIDQKTSYRYWNGQGKDIPLRYGNYDSGDVIAIIV